MTKVCRVPLWWKMWGKMFVVCYSQEECVQRILKKFQGSNKPFPLLDCGLKRIVHHSWKFSIMKVYRQIKTLTLFLLPKIISMKQYIISLFMRKVCWYLFAFSSPQAWYWSSQASCSPRCSSFINMEAQDLNVLWPAFCFLFPLYIIFSPFLFSWFVMKFCFWLLVWIW